MSDAAETSGLPAPRERRARSGRRELDHVEDMEPEEGTPEPEAPKSLEISPLLEYLKTPQGHELTTRIVAILEDVKKAALTHGSDQFRRELWFRGVVVVAVIAAATVLAVLDKFSTPVGILFGALMGYILKKGT